MLDGALGRGQPGLGVLERGLGVDRRLLCARDGHAVAGLDGDGQLRGRAHVLGARILEAALGGHVHGLGERVHHRQLVLERALGRGLGLDRRGHVEGVLGLGRDRLRGGNLGDRGLLGGRQHERGRAHHGGRGRVRRGHVDRDEAQRRDAAQRLEDALARQRAVLADREPVVQRLHVRERAPRGGHRRRQTRGLRLAGRQRGQLGLDLAVRGLDLRAQRRVARLGAAQLQQQRRHGLLALAHRALVGGQTRAQVCDRVHARVRELRHELVRRHRGRLARDLGRAALAHVGERRGKRRVRLANVLRHCNVTQARLVQHTLGVARVARTERTRHAVRVRRRLVDRQRVLLVHARQLRGVLGAHGLEQRLLLEVDANLLLRGLGARRAHHARVLVLHRLDGGGALGLGLAHRLGVLGVGALGLERKRGRH